MLEHLKAGRVLVIDIVGELAASMLLGGYHQRDWRVLDGSNWYKKWLRAFNHSRSVLPPITRLANANDVILRVFVNHNTCFYSDVGIRLSVSLFQIYIMTSLVYTCCEGACNNVCGLKHLMQPRLTARQSLSHASITCHMF